jgi:hypothetical protein
LIDDIDAEIANLEAQLKLKNKEKDILVSEKDLYVN